MGNATSKAHESGRVAVIAVHGVGDPGAGSTAQSIVNLLKRLVHGTQPVYQPFVESGLTLSNEPAPSLQPHELRELKVEFTDEQRKRGVVEQYEVDDDPTRFIGTQLADYVMEDDDRTFDTVCHQGQRPDPGGGPAPLNVDVYELYWADLIRLVNGPLGFFTDLYQLIFHVPHLANKAVAAESRQHEEQAERPEAAKLPRTLWGGYQFLCQLCAYYLAVQVFFFNIWLAPILAITGLLLAHHLTFFTLGLAIAGALFGLAAFRAWKSEGRSKGRLQIFLLLGGCCAIGAYLFLGAVTGPEDESGQQKYLIGVTATLLFLLCACVIVPFIRSYNLVFPNSAKAAYAVGIGMWLVWLFSVIFHRHMRDAGLDTLWLLIIVGNVNYGFLLLLEFVTVMFGVVAWSRARKTPRASQVTRVFFTSVLGLGLPTVLFSLVTIPIWAIVAEGIMPWFFPAPDMAQNAAILLDFGSIGFEWSVLLVAVALMAAIALLLPSVLAENLFFTPNPVSSGRLSRWLSGGAVSVPFIVVVVFAAALVPSGFFIYATFLDWKITGLSHVGVISGLLAVLGISVIALKDQIVPWTTAVGPVLNKALDVDGYLRQNPAERTPKARIFCRYASLLRHIFSHPAKYSHVVILAHSQGTIITADLLKYLGDKHVTIDPLLVEEQGGERRFLKPISLFTMGCPLRQLYSERFPSWYDWARSAEVKERPKPPGPPELKPDIAPRNEVLGVEAWSNAYGSGDYIGRSLWRGADDPDFADLPSPKPSWDITTPLIVSEKPNGATREFCIGPLAHTRYWDEPGDAVARELDRLITAKPQTSQP